MNRENNSVDEVFDILLKKAAAKADEEIGRELDKPYDDIRFSERHMENMKKMFRAEARRIKMKKIMKYSRRCACFVAVFLVVATVTVFKVDALRIRFLTFNASPDKPNADLNFSDDKSTYYRDKDINIDYIPAGFELIEKDSDEKEVFRAFDNGDMWINISRSDIDSNHNIDTENMTIENIKIRGHEARLLTRPSLTILFWYDDYNIYIISSNLSGEEVIKIGENTV